MKTLKILLLLLVLIPFSNIFSQYFVDHDKVEQVWQQNVEGYWAKPEEVKDRNIYLNAIHKSRINSDVKIGFDKLDYKSGDLIIVTLKRGYANEADSVTVTISGCNVFSDPVKMQKSEQGPYDLYLKKGQEVEINLNCRGGKGEILGFSFGGIHFESRNYHIIYSDKLQEGEFGDSVNSTDTDGKLILEGVQKTGQIKLNVPFELTKSPGMID